MPNDYQAVPIEPTERYVVAQWIGKPPRDEDAQQGYRPKLEIVWIDWVPDAVSLTGDAQRPPPVDDGPESLEPPRPPVNSFERYLDRFYRRNDGPFWSIGEAEVGKERDGYRTAVHALEPRIESPLRGTAHVFRNGQRSVVLFGTCLADDLDAHGKIWRRMADKLELGEPVGVDLAKWQKFYEKRPELVGAEYRLGVRAKLVRGWDAVDTENFIFVYSTKDEVLLRILQKELEAIRIAYLELFPPSRPITAVSTVRVCRDRDEYFAYGGPPGSGGYWNSVAEELVFFDYEDREGDRGSGKEDTRIVLYHEAFHQYVHYSTGELPPHSWYNEGTGDYFSGALIQSGKVKKIDVNPWRCALIQDALEKRRTIPWEEIVEFEQPEFYRPDRIGVCYAQAWSMNFFLLTSKEVAKRPEWARIHRTYFETLKTAYAAELAKLAEEAGEPEEAEPEGGSEGEPEGEPEAEPEAGGGAAGGAEITQEEDAFEPSPEQKHFAGLAARKAANEAAFEGIDFAEIEAAWREFTLALKPPKR